MGHNTSVQQFFERLNSAATCCFFPGKNPKHLDPDEIIEILDQVKVPEWHEAMVNANIVIFEMYYEETHLKCLENLENIRRTYGSNRSSLPIEYKKSQTVTSSVDKSSKNNKGSNMWCHFCDKQPHYG
jgi:hypothetical protein